MNQSSLALLLLPPGDAPETAMFRDAVTSLGGVSRFRVADSPEQMEAHEPLVVLAPDLPLGSHMQDALNLADGRGPGLTAVVWVPLMPAAPHDPAQQAQERAWLDVVQQGRAWAAAVSRHMTDYLTRTHGLPAARVLPLPIGPCPAAPRFAPQRPRVRARILAQAGVPPHRPLLVGWGALEDGMGHETLIELAHGLGGDLHLVLTGAGGAVMPNVPHCTAVCHPAPDLMQALFQWPNARLAAWLPGERPIAEALVSHTRALAARGGPLALALDRHGLAELVEHGVDGFVTSQAAPAQLSSLVRGLLRWPEARFVAARRRAAERIGRERDWTTALTVALDRLAAHWPAG